MARTMDSAKRVISGTFGEVWVKLFVSFTRSLTRT